MFKRIDHVEIVTDKPAETIAFYTDVLGFKVRERDRVERAGTGVALDLVYLELGGTTVELITFNGAKVDPAPQNECSMRPIKSASARASQTPARLLLPR